MKLYQSIKKHRNKILAGCGAALVLGGFAFFKDAPKEAGWREVDLEYTGPSFAIQCPTGEITSAGYKNNSQDVYTAFFLSGRRTPFAVYRPKDRIISHYAENGKVEKGSKKKVAEGDLIRHVCDFVATLQKTEI